ncbi:hypothetical protein [Hydrogenophilus thermoluteolus]|uniref:Uncharacterized protein n=1 Tax=Hydrogenophilus thermoluteolus TaxID=297 RepID=A0A2Z6DVJ8_HYDTE|nr:hypothetical protein [Hydrogenophilus thermoluteolus]BBD76445.1 hypothetical protein HPTL_0175 [Hydrogenophilus thermoluteolus]
MRPALFYLSETTGLLSIPAQPQSDAPILCVIDHPSESMTRITVPPLWGRDLRLYLERRLAQNYPETPYRVALPISSGTSFRPAREWLLLAVTETEWLDPLLTPCLERESPIVGVWTASQLISSWLSRYIKLREPLLAVVRTPAGIRILFQANQRTQLSRLLPGETDSASIATELDRTVRYLHNQKILPREQRPVTLFLGTTPPEPASTTAWQPYSLPAKVQRRFPTVTETGLAALIPWWCRQWHRPPSLAPRSLTAAYRWQQARLALVAAGSLLSAGVLLYAGAIALESWSVRMNRLHSEQLHAQLQQRLARISAEINAFGVAADQLLAATHIHEQLFASAGTFPALLIPLSHALTATPEYRLERLTLSRPDPAPPPASGATTEATPTPQHATSTTDAPADCPPPATDSAASTASDVALWLYAEGQANETLPLKQLLDAETRFRTQLAAPGWRIVSFQPPVATDRNTTLSGENASLKLQPFRLCLAWSPSP